MVKRILLIFLFLFMPIFANADIIGTNIDEKNIPLNIDIMNRALNLALSGFDDYESIRGRFYYKLNTQIDELLSMKGLYTMCYYSSIKLGENTDERSAKCQDFVRYYVQGLSGTPIDYNNKKIRIDIETSVFTRALDKNLESY